MTLIAVALALLIANVASQEVRLTKALVPEHYGLSMKTYLDTADGSRQFTFDGESTITIRCVTPTNQITMHARDLTIDIPAIQVRRDPNGPAISVTGVTQDQTRETMTISLSTQLASNDRISVVIRYRGNHRPDMTGFYRTSYQQNSQTSILVAAHMQPNFAHTVFPCFDEPSFRANFTLIIQHRQGRRAWSNMPAKSEKDLGNGWKETSFSTSPSMPTYVFSIVVADFQCQSKATTRNVQMSVCARPDAIASGQVQFALNEAVSHYQFLENFFEVSLPLPKYDLMAIPNYAWYAVENWGLLFFVENIVLLDPTKATPQGQKVVSNSVAHELTHQWDGSLVTSDWWNDFWVKEGVANWLQLVASNVSQPTWNDVQLVLEAAWVPGSYFDGQENSRPLNDPKITLTTMQSYFSAFNFNKATMMFRMLYSVLGETTFRKGFGNFLRTRAYSAVTAADLWQALTDQARIYNTLPSTLTVKDVMDTWADQPGLPLLRVSRQADNTLALTQTRFMVEPGVTAPFNSKWWIPISWASSSNGVIRRQQTVQWMPPSGAAPRIDVGPSPNWYLVNVDVAGFYRVLYDNDNWMALAQQLRVDRNQIPTLTRAQLFMDSFSLNRAEFITPTVYLSLMASMNSEQEYTVWEAADIFMGYMADIIGQRDVYPYFKQFMACRLADQMSLINIESSESFRPLQLAKRRQLIVKRSCEYGVPQCVTPALKLWSTWRSRPFVNPIPEDVRLTVYCLGVREGSTDDWFFARSKMLEPGYPQNDATNLRQALTCTRNVTTLTNLLDSLKRNDAMSPPNVIAETLGFLFQNPSSTRVAWKWWKDNRQWAQQQLATAPVPFVAALRTLSFKLALDTDLSDLKTFQNFVVDTGAKATFDAAVGQVSANIRWRTTNEGVLLKGLVDLAPTTVCAFNSGGSTPSPIPGCATGNLEATAAAKCPALISTQFETASETGLPSLCELASRFFVCVFSENQNCQRETVLGVWQKSFDYYSACCLGFPTAACPVKSRLCLTSPCLNGATCMQVGTGTSCTCAPGFTGSRCEVNTVTCTSNRPIPDPVECDYYYYCSGAGQTPVRLRCNQPGDRYLMMFEIQTRNCIPASLFSGSALYRVQPGCILKANPTLQ